MAKSRVPKYRIGRVFLFPILLYFMLVFPMLVFMLLKSFPQLTEKGVFRNMQETDSLNVSQLTADTLALEAEAFSAQKNIYDRDIPPDENISADADSPNREKKSGGINIQVGNSPGNNTSSAFSDTFSSLFKIVILFSTITGFAINIPFRRYFNRKRKGRRISPKLYRYCRRFLLYTPLINSGIVLLAFSIVHGLMIYQLQTPEMLNDPISRRMFSNYLFISLVASLLTVLFIYFWQKHRVHIKYFKSLLSD